MKVPKHSDPCSVGYRRYALEEYHTLGFRGQIGAIIMLAKRMQARQNQEISVTPGNGKRTQMASLNGPACILQHRLT